MESSEHNWAHISETICPEMLAFGEQASWMLLFSEYLDKSQAAQAHVTKVARDLSAGRVGVASQATVENKRR